MPSPGEDLLELMACARHHVLLVAPFIKQSALERILNAIQPTVPVLCITRWDPREIIAGVSDLEVWNLLNERPDADLRVLLGLHAKLYRADEQCLVGSANLTGAALGWSQRANLELLVPVDGRDQKIVQFEQTLMAHSVPADRTLYESMKQAVDALRAAGVQFPSPDALAETMEASAGIASWLPSCRAPDRLFDAYQGRDDRMLTSAFEDAQRDLAVIDPPPNLDRDAFNAYVAALLEQLPVIRDIDDFVRQPRSSEELSRYLAERMGESALEPGGGEPWDTLKLWLLTFFPHRYRTKPPEGAEVFVRGRRLT